MTRAPGKSLFLGLLFAGLLLFSTTCRSTHQTQDTPPKPENVSATRVKLLVHENGLHAVSRQELSDFGLEIAGMNSSNLRLSQGGETVPALFRDDQLIFYGQAPQSRYTSTRPYLLEIGRQGAAVKETAVTNPAAAIISEVPQTLHLEENHIYTAEARQDEEDDVWFWSELRQQSIFESDFDIHNLADAPAILRINTWGFTDNPDIALDHDFDLLINDERLGTISWDGQNYNLSESTIPAGTLRQGKNTITLDNQVAGSSFLDIMHVNWFELEYLSPAIAVDDQLTFSTAAGIVQMQGFSDKPVIFDISDTSNPALLQGWEYNSGQVDLPVAQDMVIAAAGPAGISKPAIESVREADWRNPEKQADLIIITTDELAPALAPLIEAREAQGLSVALLPVADIYDEFGYGENSPESIRDFITYAYETWQEPHPRYLFLVGDATTDYLGHMAEIPHNIVPSLLVPVQYSGETVSDSRLVDINGDRQPDLAVGRWPVRTLQEVENLVERTLAYEQGIANEKVLFAADGSEARFSSIADYLTKTSQIPAEQVQILNGPQASEIAEHWRAGPWLAAYIGHGSISRWGKKGMVDLDSASSLSSETPPILLQLTCLTGLFSHPVETSLTEALLTNPQGPVLTVAATSLTLSANQEPFAIELLQQIQDSNIIRIGDAFQNAKLSLEIDSTSGLREISDTFALFGDPSTIIMRP